MNTCGTCKYFGERRPSDYDNKGNEIPSAYHECDLIEHNDGYTPKPSKSAYVIDASGYFAALCVKDDFGCNQWAGAKPCPFCIGRTGMVCSTCEDCMGSGYLKK